MSVPSLITQHLDVWTSAIETRSTAGRGSSNKLNLYGIKKLRELILELAVRGQLVPQNPYDEPANILLEKIAAEKARLIKDGKLKKQEPLPPITDDEKSFELPKGWEWVIFDDVAKNKKNALKAGPFGSALKKSMYVKSGYKIYGQEQVISGDERHGDYYINQEKYEMLESCKVEAGDILISLVGTIGKVLILSSQCKEGIINPRLVKLSLNDVVNRFYIQLVLESPFVRGKMREKSHGGTMDILNLGLLRELTSPFPPLAEQHRIVAKVNELMLLCDALEQEQAANIAAHQTLVEQLLAELTQKTPSPQPLSRQAGEGLREEEDEASCSPSTASRERGLGGEGLSWQRIAAHFDTLFTTEHSIDQLKQTILQLAVMGKLVPQDPNDEPASVLLQKIAAEKARLIKAGKIKKEKPLPPIAEDEKPFDLPDGWEWCRLDDLAPEFQNGASSRGDKDGSEVIVLRLADIKNWRVSLQDTRSLIIDSSTISRYLLQKDDVLIIRVNGSADIVGRFIICEGNYDAIYCDHFIRMRFLLPILNSSYLGILGSSDLVRKDISNLFISTAGQKTVNQKHIGSLKIALPPPAEQHRIVAKVDELMALCDAMKAQIKTAQTTQLQLANVLAEQAMEGDA
jgi:type I restriction enzyme S subunit